MEFQLSMTVRVDVQAWAREYGLTAEEAAADAKSHLSDLILDSARALSHVRNQLASVQAVRS
jgi:hypothetical protein